MITMEREGGREGDTDSVGRKRRDIEQNRVMGHNWSGEVDK